MTNTQKQKRRPKFKRDNSVLMNLEERDKEIIKLVYENRLMTSDQIKAFVPGSKQVITRRLGKLFHAGYLDRPEAQKEPFLRRPMVYALGDLGASFLSVELDLDIDTLDWPGKNRQAKINFLDHTIMVSQLLVIIQLACRKYKNINFVRPEQIIGKRPGKIKGHPMGWKINVSPELAGGKDKKINVIPDSVFGLEFNVKEKIETSYFFIEADRGSEPIKRANLFRSSIYKKLICYLETWRKKKYNQEFGFNQARVLFVTKETSRKIDQQRRIISMINANKEIDPRGTGFGIFCFASMNQFSLDDPEQIFKKIWTNGRSETVSLLD